MKSILLLTLLITVNGAAQNTVSLPEGARSPKADLSQIAWMTGHWKGEAFGGITEEIWSPPLGGSMMCVFKLVSDGAVNFYEICHIRKIEETLWFELKHFHTDLKGWEEKDEVQSFKLVKIEGNRVYFDGFTFERIDANEVNIYFVIAHTDGSTEEVKFNYKRV
ncbi:MAG: DUF6265 family protein [Maribacter sp.]|nr:DUF6265 family protein [Maribacter sp.]